MGMFDDYELEPETIRLQQIFRNGVELLETGRDFESCAREASDFLYELDEKQKGLVALDLLVMVGNLEYELNILRMKEMEL